VVNLAGALLLGRRLDARLGVAMLVGYTGHRPDAARGVCLDDAPGERPMLGAH
jgi:hypothetical protein